MEKLLDSYKGLVLFYIIVAIMAFLFTLRISSLNEIVEKDNIVVVETIYA